MSRRIRRTDCLPRQRGPQGIQNAADTLLRQRLEMERVTNLFEREAFAVFQPNDGGVLGRQVRDRPFERLARFTRLRLPFGVVSRIGNIGSALVVGCGIDADRNGCTRRGCQQFRPLTGGKRRLNAFKRDKHGVERHSAELSVEESGHLDGRSIFPVEEFEHALLQRGELFDRLEQPSTPGTRTDPVYDHVFDEDRQPGAERAFPGIMSTQPRTIVRGQALTGHDVEFHRFVSIPNACPLNQRQQGGRVLVDERAPPAFGVLRQERTKLVV